MYVSRTYHQVTPEGNYRISVCAHLEKNPRYEIVKKLHFFEASDSINFT